MQKQGNFLASSLRKARNQQAAYAVLCAGVSLFLVSRGPASLLGRDPISLLAATAAVLSFMQFRSLSQKAGRLSAGASAEKSVARSLSKVKASRVLHSVDLSAGGDADHIVLGPMCAVVETKYAKGVVKPVKGGLTASGKRIPRDPVSQARRQAAALRRVSGVWTEAVVCVTGMTNKPFVEGGVTVCSLDDLPRIVASMPAVLQGSDVDRVCASIGVPNLKR